MEVVATIIKVVITATKATEEVEETVTATMAETQGQPTGTQTTSKKRRKSPKTTEVQLTNFSTTVEGLLASGECNDADSFHQARKATNSMLQAKGPEVGLALTQVAPL